MKQNNTIWNILLASACCILLYACTGEQEELSRLNEGTQSSSTDSRATEPVTTHVILTDTDRLEAKLTEALGDAAPTVQKLTISGTFNAIDVEFLHTLTALQSLDMTDVTIKYNNEHPSYSFTYAYVDPDGNTVEGNVNDYLFENKISNQMFAGMISLKEFKIPTTIDHIGWHAFEGCTSLEAINIPPNIKSIDRPFTNSGLTTLTVEEGITSISGLGGCPRLKTVNLPSTLTEIGSEAFRNCSSLESITIPDGVTQIGSLAFNSCSQLKTVNLPSTLKEIGSYAFEYCSSLESITIPDGIAKIELQTFANTGLTSIRLPNALKEIGSYAFNNTPLATFEIPASVTTLGYSVFENCKQLRTLTIPKTVSQIAGPLVYGCENLQMIEWNTTTAVPGSCPTENCFLYINSDNGTAATYDAASWPKTIVDGIADSIRLTYSTSDWGTPMKFSCPIAFTAKRISLTMEFDRYIRTQEGKSSGWRTLTLPFKVSSITSEQKGVLAPFGSDVEGAKPFWLRSLTPTGFQDATSIEADKPYIIAMPNNPDVYLDEYNIWGKVTFTGENVEIAATPDELPADEGPDYLLQPTFQFVKRGGTVYALNYNYDIRNRERGSVFARSTTHVYAYEAYVKKKNDGTTRALYEIDTRSPKTRSANQKNTTGIPAIGDM